MMALIQINAPAVALDPDVAPDEAASRGLTPETLAMTAPTALMLPTMP